MAQTILTFKRRAIRFLGILSVFLLIQKGNAYDYKVGGPRGSWTVPSDPNAAIYNQWAEKNRFQIDDTLLFVYDANHDSVLHVTKDDYTNCNTEAPLEKFTDGHTVFKFNQSGPCYFISGVADNCHKNEKLVLIVMADRSKSKSNETVSSPPPSPSADMAPPAPAPAGEESPPPAPSDKSSHSKNSASSIVAGGIGTVAAFVGASLVLAI
ncbi:hypothetical protein BUALT_Bualt03G0120000 [Buddleja alternifolia]|uniref:Phytocyanin domain-containing protein n=1 Tax=Buddleja alternifolia TaxID=168488 RepID=A0AAV6XVC1_9LAMI|nr:hypothetical protein BUALT_Bualt03G0120000 [Buddleja alternifolia]